MKPTDPPSETRSPAPPPPRQPDTGSRPRRGDDWLSWPNRITLVRLGLVPVLWFVAATGETTWLGVGLAAAASTDVVDGTLARYLRQTTELGSRLDSLADHALTASVVLWLVWLKPEFIYEHRRLLIPWMVLAAAALAVGWLRFRVVGALHLYSAKAAAALGYLFVVWLFVSGSYPVAALYFVVGCGIAAAIETLAVFLTRSSVDERVGSILLPERRQRSGSPRP
jgi:cardiolipin synthase (CMP-forming)